MKGEIFSRENKRKELTFSEEKETEKNRYKSEKEDREMFYSEAGKKEIYARTKDVGRYFYYNAMPVWSK